LSEFEILRETEGPKGRYVIRAEGGEAELTYSVSSPTLVIADHVGVSGGLRGKGAGRALVGRLVADAMSEGFKIVPLCPFVNAQRVHHPHWSEAFAV